ncbi:MAG: hypothetical protein ACR2GH_21900 [Pseudonocardia sp.]
MTAPDPTMPVCVLLTERGHGDLSVGHPYDIFWRIPRDHTSALRRALTDALIGCGLHPDPSAPRRWDDSPDLPKLPGSIAVWRGDDDTLTIGLAADAHHRVRAEHTEALRHAILAALHDRATDPGRDSAPPWPTTESAPSSTAPTDRVYQSMGVAVTVEVGGVGVGAVDGPGVRW